MSETEKITINLSAMDLGRIDLLVAEGYYSNRTDFIRTAIRKELDLHNDFVKQTVTRRTMALGVVSYSRSDFEKARQQSAQYDIQVIGTLFLADDISPELAQAVIKRVKVYGIFQASQDVKEALADRID
jgi:Arc/MetJ-type ribon-helix-helix transcriptional regulator